MQRHALDRILACMLQAHTAASDLNFTVGHPPQVEVNGQTWQVHAVGGTQETGGATMVDVGPRYS